MDTENFTHYVEVIKEIYKQDGVKGFYRGYWPTFWRDVPSFASFFFVYEYIQRGFIKPDDTPMVAHAKKLGAIGVAGIFNHCPFYPFDVIKSNIQIDKNKVPKTMIEVFKYGYN